MREAVKEKNKDPNTINPLSAVDLVIDHSVQVDQSAKSDSFEKNVDIEFGSLWKIFRSNSKKIRQYYNRKNL